MKDAPVAPDDPADAPGRAPSSGSSGAASAPPGRRARALWRAPARLARLPAQLNGRWPWLRVVVFALAGAAVALALLGRVPAKVGPFETTMAVRPSLTGHTVVHLAPLGTIELDTHDWPLALDLRVDEISVADAERIAADPRAIDRLGEDAADEVRDALVGLALRCVVVALLGGATGALVARLSWRTGAAGLGVASLLVAGLGGGAAATFDANAVSEPRYTGLLSRAPAAVGDIEDVIARFGEYRSQLSDLVDNMATLYLAGSDLPTFEADGRLIRVLHVSDIHLNPQAFDLMERMTTQFGLDAIVDTGDLTDWGTEPETEVIERIGDLEVPYIYVRGNHDSRRTQAAVADQPNAVVLDGDGAEVAGLHFWGIGDPRYTPDKSEGDGRSEGERAEAFAPDVAERMTADEPPAVDVALVHDQRMAGALGGEVPLVLAGHTHDAEEKRIEPLPADTTAPEGDDAEGIGDAEGATPADDGTLLLIEGSTGGAGLRGLQGEEPEPLSASILYFDPDTRRLVAYDRITVAWLGDAGATIDRHIVDRAPEAARTEETDADGVDGAAG